MPITVEVPDVGEVEFPDEMKPDDIKSVLGKRFGKKEAPKLAGSQLGSLESGGEPTAFEQPKHPIALPSDIEQAQWQARAAQPGPEGENARSYLALEDIGKKLDVLQQQNRAARNPVSGLPTGLGTIGRMIPAALADVSAGTEEGQPSNVESALRGETPTYQQTYSNIRRQAPALSLAGKAVAGALSAVPQVAGVALEQGLGIPAPVAAAHMFGFDNEGNFDPKSAAIAAVLPVVGKLAGGVATKVASKLGVESQTALNLVNAGGGFAAANALLLAQARFGGDWDKLSDEQKQDAIAGVIGNSLLGLMDLHGLKADANGKVNLQEGSRIFQEAAERAQTGIEPFNQKILSRTKAAEQSLPLAAKEAQAAQAEAIKPSTTEATNAEAIRENQGQRGTPGQVAEGGEANRGGDVEQAAPGQPKPVESGKEKEARAPEAAPGEVALKPLTPDDVTDTSRRGSKVMPGNAIITKNWFASQDWSNPNKWVQLMEREAETGNINQNSAEEMGLHLRELNQTDPAAARAALEAARKANEIMRAKMKDLMKSDINAAAKMGRVVQFGRESAEFATQDNPKYGPSVEQGHAPPIDETKPIEPKGGEKLEKEKEGQKVLTETQPEAEPAATPGIVDRPVKNHKEAAKAFDDLVMENAERAGWTLRPDDLHMNVGETKSQPGTAAIKAKVARDKEVAKVRRVLAQQLGLDPDKMGNAKYRAEHLNELQQHLSELFPDEGDLETAWNPEGVIESGTQEITKTPKLAAGVKQGDLLSSTQAEPLALVGEKGTDAERVAAAKAKSEREAAEAKEIEEKQQQQLIPVGPGSATRPGAKAIVTDIGNMEGNIPPLEQLAQVVASFPKQKGSYRAQFEQWLTDIGVPVKEKTARAWAMLRAVYPYIKEKATTLKEIGDLDRRVGQWNEQDWTGGEAARAFGNQIKRMFQDRSKLRALSNWINAGGDKDLLARQASLTKNPALRKTYEDALKFGPDEEKLAAGIKHYHDQMLAWGQREGALEEGLDNYLHRYYRSDDPVLQKKLQALEYLRFSKDFNGFKKRYYDSDFEAEQAGLTPEKDAAKRILAYDYGFRQALVAREFVKNSFNSEKAVAKDGRPELDIVGGGRQLPPKEADDLGLTVDPRSGAVIPRAEKGKGVTLISPKWKNVTKEMTDEEKRLADRSDYVMFNHPAFRKWKWAASDENGKPILVQGDILVHPDFAKKYQALFEQSWWAKTPARRAAKAVSGFVKQTMLLGPFHLFQITTGGIEHRINPFRLLELNTSDPAQQRMASHGLFAEEGPYATEGVGGGGLLDKIPVAGQFFQGAKDWLFKDYIPRWKMTLALAAEARNLERYAPEMRAGKVTPEQISRMSARQAAAVFGGQNQRAIFRSRTFQDNLRMLFLAPDFGEERLRQVLQAGGKYGHEQRAALVLGGAAMMVLAKTIEYALTGEMHLGLKDIMTVRYNGKQYGMRNPASDIAHLITDPIGYIRNRLNPVYTRPLLELFTGRDAFGRKRSAGQQLADEIKQVVPIPGRGLVEKNQSVWESLLNSTGITEHKRSAFGDVMKTINDWKDKKGYNAAAEFVYDADKDPYYGLTQRLSQNDPAGAVKELRKLTDGKTTSERAKVYQHYLKSLVQHRYLTGSRAHEAEFLKEASASDKQTYQEAKQERAKMWETFKKAWAQRTPLTSR